MAGLHAQQHEDLFHRALGLRRWDGPGARGIAEGVGGIGDELGRHPGRRQLVVHQAGGDHAARHAVKFRGFRCLGHGHPAAALDRAHAERAVAAGAREHDPDRPFVLVLRERPEEEIDRQPLAARRGGFEQLQRAVEERHVAARRDDVGAVRAHDHPVFDLEDLHARVAPDQLGQQALVVRCEVLHEHERHARIRVRGHAGKKRLECGEPTGRRADADNRKTGSGRHIAGAPLRLFTRRKFFGAGGFSFFHSVRASCRTRVGCGSIGGGTAFIVGSRGDFWQ